MVAIAEDGSQQLVAFVDQAPKQIDQFAGKSEPLTFVILLPANLTLIRAFYLVVPIISKARSMKCLEVQDPPFVNLTKLVTQLVGHAPG